MTCCRARCSQAGNDSARFLINSTFGLGGLFDPASAAGLDFNDEDFGQTFGKWGVKPGPYLVLPFLGRPRRATPSAGSWTSTRIR